MNQSCHGERLHIRTGRKEVLPMCTQMHHPASTLNLIVSFYARHNIFRQLFLSSYFNSSIHALFLFLSMCSTVRSFPDWVMRMSALAAQEEPRNRQGDREGDRREQVVHILSSLSHSRLSPILPVRLLFFTRRFPLRII